MKRIVVVYIASQYTIGDQAVNVRRQMDAADELMNLGLVPIAPLLSHFQHLVHPRPYQDWLKFDLELVLRSDAVLRLPGESKGADGEVGHANNYNIPVFYGIDYLKDYLKDYHKVQSECEWIETY